MNKAGAFIILILILGVIGYVYYTNTGNVGVQIQKLKLKYAISPNSNADTIYHFSQDLGKITPSNVEQKKILNFERNYWIAVSINKKITRFLYNKENVYAIDCKNPKINSLRNDLKTEKDKIKMAKTLFNEIKEKYPEKTREEFEASLNNLDSASNYLSGVISVSCPK